MGGDTPPHLLFPAILDAAGHFATSASLLVLATPPVIKTLSASLGKKSKGNKLAQIDFHPVDDVIHMEDDPIWAVRNKKESSLVVGMRLLKKNRIDALVSCGNTGALVAGATTILRLLPHVKRAALLVALPTKKGSLAVLDVGGNVSCKAEHLVQFALLGAAYQSAIARIAVPKVGLLNIGTESKKGTEEVCKAYDILKGHYQNPSAALCFAGNVEGRDVFSGSIDVLVTDGFTGNVLLKTAEGVAAFILENVDEAIGDEDSAKQMLAALHKQFNYTEHPGAMICGADGVVIKVHGNATAQALFASILKAAECVTKQVVALIKAKLSLERF